MKIKVLIIGVSGLLGKKLYEIGRNNYNVFGTYNKHEIKGKRNFRLDATNKDKVFFLINKIKPDLVIDAHSITNVDYCETHNDAAWDVNITGLRNLAEVCKVFSSKLIFISTDYVFDGYKLSYEEKDKPHPINYYGKTKAIGERILDILESNYIVARSSVLYGYGDRGKKTFVSWVIENLKSNNEIRVVIDQFNRPTYATNLAEILYQLYEKDVAGLFHVVGEDTLSRYEFALKIANHFSLDKKLIKPITTAELNQVAPRPLKLNLSTNKLERILGRKLIGIDKGLKLLKREVVS